MTVLALAFAVLAQFGSCRYVHVWNRPRALPGHRVLKDLKVHSDRSALLGLPDRRAQPARAERRAPPAPPGQRVRQARQVRRGRRARKAILGP